MSFLTTRVLPYDRLANSHFPENCKPPIPETGGDVSGDKFRVIVSGHPRGSIKSSKSSY